MAFHCLSAPTAFPTENRRADQRAAVRVSIAFRHLGPRTPPPPSPTLTLSSPTLHCLSASRPPGTCSVNSNTRLSRSLHCLSASTAFPTTTCDQHKHDQQRRLHCLSASTAHPDRMQVMQNHGSQAKSPLPFGSNRVPYCWHRKPLQLLGQYDAKVRGAAAAVATGLGFLAWSIMGILPKGQWCP